MNSFLRAKTLAEVASRVRAGAEAGHEIKDFLHEFQEHGRFDMLQEAPNRLEGAVGEGRMLDAFLQALAVHLAVQVDHEPPEWTQNSIQLARPWFASPGLAMRNYLLMTSPSPFRTRNLFIDAESLTVA